MDTIKQPTAPETRQIGESAEEITKGHYRPYYVNSWAAVIGINNYAHLSKPLTYAVADAEGIANLLITQLDFPAKNVFVILDSPPRCEHAAYQLYSGIATKANIERLLLTDLPGKVEVDDRVLIFFAGHGKRRLLADGATRGYLMPADAQPDQWHEWIDIESILDSNLYEAKHVFYLLDSCYSGLAATRSPAETSRFEQDLLTRRARQVLTAGKDDQVVADTGGQGHSIFTNCVLEGLKDCLAAQAGSQVITGFDLMRYVTRRVALDTNSLQTPDEGVRLGHKGGDFVFRLPDSALADLTPSEHMKLGSALYELGLSLESPGRFVSAIRQFEAALNQLGIDGSTIQDAWGWIGKCRMQLGEYDKAIEAFQRLNDLAADVVPADILVAWAVAQAKRNDNARAVDTLACFLSRFPQHPYTGWARGFREALVTSWAGRQMALLIGNGSYENKRGIPGTIPELPEVKRDITAMRRFLIEDCGFDATEIRVLMDAEATRSGVIQAMRNLAQRATSDDTILIYRRGHGTQVASKRITGGSAESIESVSVCYDYDYKGNGYLTAKEMHTLINLIPAREKVVITDEDHADLDEYVKRDGTYTLYQACKRDQVVSMGAAFEGMFTCAIVGQLRSQGAPLASHGVIFDRAQEVLDLLNKSSVRMTLPVSPQFVGDAQASFLQRDSQRWFYLHLWDVAETTLSAKLHPRALTRLFRDLNAMHPDAACQRVLCRLGQALLDKGDHVAAIEVLEHAASRTDFSDDEVLLMLAKAHLVAKNCVKRKQFVDRLLQFSRESAISQGTQLQKLHDLLKRDKEHDALKLINEMSVPNFTQPISILENVIKRRKERFEDDYPEGQVNLGLYYGAVRRFEDAVNQLTLYAEPAVTRIARTDNALATEWLHDIWFFTGRWLSNLGDATDLLVAVDKLERAYKLNYGDPAVGFHFSQGLRNIIQLKILPTAKTNLGWYLLDGAPLGFEEDAREFVAASDEKGTNT